MGEEHRVGQRQVHGGRMLVFAVSRALLRFMDGEVVALQVENE